MRVDLLSYCALCCVTLSASKKLLSGIDMELQHDIPINFSSNIRIIVNTAILLGYYWFLSIITVSKNNHNGNNNCLFGTIVVTIVVAMVVIIGNIVNIVLLLLVEHAVMQALTLAALRNPHSCQLQKNLSIFQ